MRISIFLTICLIIASIEYGYGIPAETSEKTSSIVINNGVTINGLAFKEDHPLIPFTNSGRDAKCNGSCVCSGNKCNCSCYSCTNNQCIAGCVAAC